MTMSAGSNLEKVFKAGHKAVTCECGPPRGADAEHFRKKAAYLKGCADAVNVTDNQTAVVRSVPWRPAISSSIWGWNR